MKIYACHLLNDYSGSPKVLMQLVNGWVANNQTVVVVTSGKRDGFLSNLNQVDYMHFWYKWAANPYLRLINFALSQLLLFTKLLIKLKANDLVYVNTVLPFGAALAGKIRGCKVIYHVHETSIKPAHLKRFLFGVISLTATKVVYVSNYLAKQETSSIPHTHILYNAIENTFLDKAKTNRLTKKSSQKNILMVCSLKAYKGVFEFNNLAMSNPQYYFTLVVNDSIDNINHFFSTTSLAKNLTIYPSQSNLHPFYQHADLVVNLSRVDEWVETFGLTIIEAMAYGIPVIVPPIGGIAELVTDGENGFKVNSYDTNKLNQTLPMIIENPNLLNKMQQNCIKLIENFSEQHFITNSLKILTA